MEILSKERNRSQEFSQIWTQVQVEKISISSRKRRIASKSKLKENDTPSF